jgi:two-component system sensor histidine kinase/response regulator
MISSGEGGPMNYEKKHSRVLIVDDTLKNIQVLGTVLREEGYQINVAQDGLQALTAVGNVAPDLILLDIMMPNLDGYETCKRLKEDPATHDIPVIFLTAKAETQDLVKGFELGAVDYVTKPFNTTELLVRVENHLTIRRLQQELEQRVEDIDRMNREHEAFLRHELKNRITPILGYSDLLKMANENLPDDQKEWVSVIYESAVDMTALIDEMKKLQDFEAGNFELLKLPFDLDALVKKVISDLETVYGDRVSICLEGSLEGTILGDATLLKGVFQNLIKNGLEHVVELEAESDRRVDVQLTTGKGDVTVEVKNGGDPVPQEKVSTFFEKFNTERKEKGGTGLGTTYAYLVTQAHGGTISVVSSESEGTIVTVKLPRE